MAKRREQPSTEDDPRQPGAFRVADWTDLPLHPPYWFRVQYECMVGTKGSLEEEWFLRRAVNAARLRNAARRQENR